jgi:hypothetical protein
MTRTIWTSQSEAVETSEFAVNSWETDPSLTAAPEGGMKDEEPPFCNAKLVARHTRASMGVCCRNSSPDMTD